MKKGKIKEFVKNHKGVIINTAIIGTGVLCGALGYKYGHEYAIKNEYVLKDCNTIELLCSADNMHKAKACFSLIDTNGIKPEQLGELGKAMIRCGFEKQSYTHFLVIGEKVQ